jgi:hypothetical protein
VRSALVAFVLVVGCGGAREGAGAGVLRPATFTLELNGIEMALEVDGSVRAADCSAIFDFPSVTLCVSDGHVVRLVGDAWPREVVYDDVVLPIRIDESRVTSGESALFVAEAGTVRNLTGGRTPPAELIATGLEPDETTTALAFLALLPFCWETNLP